MYHNATPDFTTTFINRITNLLTGRIENLSEMERTHNGNSHRPKHNRLREPFPAHREHGRDLPGHRDAGSRSSPNPDHIGNHLCDLRDSRGSSWNDQRSGTRTLPISRNVTHFGSLQAPIILLLLISSIVVPVLADVTVSFSPLNLDAETLMVHNSTGTLIGVYNTSTKGIVLVNNESYSILVQPESSNLLTNHPDMWFSNFLTRLKAQSAGILLIVFVAAVIIAAYKRW